jgi:hypothetical protein
MLRLTGPKTIAAALAGGLALMAVSISAAQADDWHGNGHGRGHDKGWDRDRGGWDGGPRVVVRNGYYYAPPPRVYYAPPPVYYEAPPPVYYAPPPPVYYAPAPAISLQFRL